ncbi:MAG TPA: DUF2298 domain-containing protein [Candidatus Sumerlaeota bacterium]|nr:DUF2298 domain-containing protein [Candidatus Sumerlaeota bacterium]
MLNELTLRAGALDFLWALYFLIGFELLSLPLRLALSGSPASPDARRILSRIAGPAALAMIVWFVGHLGGAWLDWPAAWLVFLLAAAVGGALSRGAGWAARLAYDPNRLSRSLLLDALVAALFLGFMLVRRWAPEMTSEIGASAAEKFGNAMIFWANWFAPAEPDGLPVTDYWFAGHALTYYDWGHFHWAWVGRMLGIPAPLALNLALARVTALVFEAAWLLGRAAGLRAGWAAGAALLTAWGGNLAAIRGVRAVFGPTHAGINWTAYDFWAPSRAIDHVVDEFPAFSAILGDFHAHHLALAWLLAWLALLLAGARWSGRGRATAWVFGATGVILAMAAVLANLWNLPLVAAVGVLALLLASRARRRTPTGLIAVLLALGCLLAAAIALQRGGEPLPLATGGEPAGPLSRLPLRLLPAHLRSQPAQLLGLWGLPLLLVALLVFRGHLERRWRGWKAALPALVCCVMAAALGNSLVFWLAAFVVVAGLAHPPRRLICRRAAVLLAGSCAVLLGLEVVYWPDRFTGDLVRYNSYFKFSYPVWATLWIGAVACGARTVAGLRGAARGCYGGLAGIVLAGALVYPVFAIPARIAGARRGDIRPHAATLDAYAFAANRPASAEEAELLAAIRRLVPPGEVVIEAGSLKAYDYGGRVASLAGRPVPLGWIHHEQQWRGPAMFQELDARRAEVDAFYQAPSPEEMRQRAEALGARWAIYGILERERYGPAAPARLQAAGRVARRVAAPGGELFLFDFRPDPPPNVKP